jgi:hypothetical protein
VNSYVAGFTTLAKHSALSSLKFCCKNNNELLGQTKLRLHTCSNQQYEEAEAEAAEDGIGEFVFKAGFSTSNPAACDHMVELPTTRI